MRPQFGPTLHLQEKQLVDELAYICHFNPSNYPDKQMLPAIDAYGKKKNPSSHTDISETEFMTFLGLMYAMEVVKLPIRHMYWEDIQLPVLPNFDFGKHMGCKHFETILPCLQMSSSLNQDDQVLDFINVVNNVLKSAITPGNVVALDKSMPSQKNKPYLNQVKPRFCNF